MSIFTVNLKNRTFISKIRISKVTDYVALNLFHNCSLLRLPVNLQWGGKVISETVAWFQHETDPTKNSNVFEVAQKLVQKYFPGQYQFFTTFWAIYYKLDFV